MLAILAVRTVPHLRGGRGAGVVPPAATALPRLHHLVRLGAVDREDVEIVLARMASMVSWK